MVGSFGTCDEERCEAQAKGEAGSGQRETGPKAADESGDTGMR